METKRLTRSSTDRMLGGVCAGLGKYFAIDPTLARLIFILLFAAGGSGLFLYFVLWIIMPSDDVVNPQPLTGDEFGRRAQQMGNDLRQATSQPNPRIIQFLGIGLVLLGALYLVQNLHIPFLSWFNDALVWPLVLIVIGAILLSRAFRKGE